eukprot:gene3076-biopygen9557
MQGYWLPVDLHKSQDHLEEVLDTRRSYGGSVQLDGGICSLADLRAFLRHVYRAKPSQLLPLCISPYTNTANVQFFLPLNEEMHLLTCQDLKLYGRTMGSDIEGDHLKRGCAATEGRSWRVPGNVICGTEAWVST